MSQAPHPDHVRTRVWQDGRLVDEHCALVDVSERLRRRDCLVWIDLVDPDHDSLAAIADELSLDAAAVEDAIADHERAKVTPYDSYTFVSAWATTLDDAMALTTHRVSAFVTAQALVTVHGRDWHGMADVLHRWDATGHLIAEAGSDALLHALLDSVVDAQTATVSALDEEVDSFEDELFDERPQTRAHARRVYAVRRASVEFRRLVMPMPQLASTLRRVRADHHPVMDAAWTDLYDHVDRVSEWSDSVREQLQNVFAANMSLQDLQMNVVMKKLTSWAAIIAVPTAITGFYGQNVPYPGFSTHWGFWVSLTVMLVAMGVLYVSFRRRGWL